MRKPAFFPDFSLLKKNSAFRSIFIARLFSIFALGMLNVAVPVQIQAITASTFQVSFVVALDGAGMFIGLMLGGVLSDKLDKRKLILFSRLVCGLGFIALSLNSFLSTPSLTALYLLAVWNGFFGALGLTALMAAIPLLVGRENLASAGALNIITIRLGSIISPAIAGVVITFVGVSYNYAIAAFSTLATLLPLFHLPMMPADPQQKAEHPGRALYDGLLFILKHQIIGTLILLGFLINMVGAIRVLFPALVENSYQLDPSAVGMMFAAVPLGALIAALTSHQFTQSRYPGRVLLMSAGCAFFSIALLGIITHYVFALIALVCYGYFSSINSLLQFTLVQGYTPNHFLGRVNSLWTTQFVIADAVGALALGVVSKVLTPSLALVYFGCGAIIITAIFAFKASQLRYAPAKDEQLNANTVSPDLD